MISPDSVSLPYNDGSLITDDPFCIWLPTSLKGKECP